MVSSMFMNFFISSKGEYGVFSHHLRSLYVILQLGLKRLEEGTLHEEVLFIGPRINLVHRPSINSGYNYER